jgi:hypothetical protein
VVKSEGFEVLRESGDFGKKSIKVTFCGENDVLRRRKVVMDKNCFEMKERDLKLSRRETAERFEASIPYSSILLNMLLSPSSLRNLMMRSHNSFGKYEHVAAALLFGTLNSDDDAAAAIVIESGMQIRYAL